MSKHTNLDSFRAKVIPIAISLCISTTAFGAATGTIERTSQNNTGEPGNGNSFHPQGIASQISDDGRFVVFQSWSTNLPENDTTGFHLDIYVYDRQEGIVELISRIGNEPANGTSYGAVISGNGQYVAFASYATNLVSGVINDLQDIYIFDRETGTMQRVTHANTSINDFAGSYLGSMTPDGRYLTFTSYSDDIVEPDNNNYTDIFVYDRESNTTEIVSLNNNGEQANESSFSSQISADGRFVTFWSRSTNFVADDNNESTDIFVYDRETDTIELISQSSSGVRANANSHWPIISSTGRYVVFASDADNLVEDDTNQSKDIFLYDRDDNTIELISRHTSGQLGDGDSSTPSISDDGRYITYESYASNLVNDDVNNASDVFLFDRVTGSTSLISANETSEQGDAGSITPIIKRDGTLVTFSSEAHNFSGVTGFYQTYVKSIITSGDFEADAGEDMTVEANGNPLSQVLLDGSGTTGEDPSNLIYTWSGLFGTENGQSPLVELPLGTHLVTLSVSDGQTDSVDEVNITVEDTTPPIINPPEDKTVTAAGLLTPIRLRLPGTFDLFNVTLTHDSPQQFPPGETIVTWEATDQNGNSATDTTTITVLFDFSGFSGNIESYPTLNSVKAGKTVPVKWSIPSSTGGFIADTSIVKSIEVSPKACTNEPTDSNEVEDTSTTGKSGLRYDESTEQFIYNWKTNKSMKGSCYTLLLNLIDDSTHQAEFFVR